MKLVAVPRYSDHTKNGKHPAKRCSACKKCQEIVRMKTHADHMVGKTQTRSLERHSKRRGETRTAPLERETGNTIQHAKTQTVTELVDAPIMANKWSPKVTPSKSAYKRQHSSR